MKKTKLKKIKLTFSPTTIRVLQPAHLNEVVGGERTKSDDCGGNNTGHVVTCY